MLSPERGAQADSTPTRMLDGEKVAFRMRTHVLDVRDADDDWSGIAARKERKKRQNRLNQRAKRT